MCYEPHERPPLPPVRGGAERHGEFTLLAADGVESDAFYAHPSGVSHRAVVILPDFRGLSDFYRELAIRFAEVGVHAVTIDYYTREAGREGRPPRDDGDFYRAQLNAMDTAAVDFEVDAATAWLRGLPGAGIEAIFTVGFCCGGTFAWHQAARGTDLSGNVSFYGVPRLFDEERIEKMAGPVLMLIAGQDFTPVADVEELADRISAGGAAVERELYERATHGFFSKSAEFEAECDAAWTRVLAFFDAHSAAPAR